MMVFEIDVDDIAFDPTISRLFIVSEGRMTPSANPPQAPGRAGVRLPVYCPASSQ
jgi:hypothetical protein